MSTAGFKSWRLESFQTSSTNGLAATTIKQWIDVNTVGVYVIRSVKTKNLIEKGIKSEDNETWNEIESDSHSFDQIKSLNKNGLLLEIDIFSFLKSD